MNDPIVKGSIAGIVGTLGDFFIHMISKLLFKTSTTSEYIAQLITHKEHLAYYQVFEGFLAHFAAGALTGVCLVIILHLSGKDHPYFKGLILGLALWILHVAVIPNIVNTPLPYIVRDGGEGFADLIAHISFGLLTAWALLKFSSASNKG